MPDKRDFTVVSIIRAFHYDFLVSMELFVTCLYVCGLHSHRFTPVSATITVLGWSVLAISENTRITFMK